jgi:hypothetical protein
LEPHAEVVAVAFERDDQREVGRSALTDSPSRIFSTVQSRNTIGSGTSGLVLGRGAGQQFVDQLLRGPPVSRHIESLTDPAAAHRPIHSRVNYSAVGRAALALASSSIRSSPSNASAGSMRPSELSNNDVFSVLFLVFVGSAIFFADAYTVPYDDLTVTARPGYSRGYSSRYSTIMPPGCISK